MYIRYININKLKRENPNVEITEGLVLLCATKNKMQFIRLEEDNWVFSSDEPIDIDKFERDILNKDFNLR